MPSYDVNPGLKYTRKNGSTPPTIEFFNTPTGPDPWETVVPHGKSKSFQIVPYTGPEPHDDFHFFAITFWAQDSDGNLDGQVARSFKLPNTGDSTETRGVRVDSIKANSNFSQSFTVTNNNSTRKDGSVAVQVTIQDNQQSAGQPLFTSVDPPIETPRDG